MASDLATHAIPSPIRRSWVPDFAAAAAVAAFLVLATSNIPPAAADRSIDGLGYVILVAAGASLALCRRWPAAAVGVVTVALSVYLFRDYPGGPIFVTGWVALAALSWRTNRRTGLIGAAVLCAALLGTATLDGDAEPLLHLVFVGWSIAAVLAGDLVRTRRERMHELEERARDLERTREEEARRRVAEDRLRIARDLHDSVAHAMATINVQAGAAAHVVDRRPEAAKEAFTAIQRASGDVLDELAALLGLLREPGETTDRRPTPGLGQIADLVAATGDARLPVTFAVSGPVEAVAVPVATAAYRIVQESLTNVIRHAGAAPTTVAITVEHSGALTVEVRDEGLPGATVNGSTTGTGMGIRGMRERAEATGGTLTAGPQRGGGFAVRARWDEPA